MEKYDSSIETLKHIKQVAIYIGLIQKELENSLRNNLPIKSGINDATLVDLLRILLDGNDLPSYSKLFNDINNNSKIYKLGNVYNDKEELFHIYDDEFIDRKENHDKSKLMEPEKHEFDIWTPRLHEASVGSPMYDYFLKELRKALEHHYRYNRHHPEHFGNGINGMSIMDLTEMLCDWKASAERHDDGDIYLSIEILANRFNYSTPMKKVLSNTCDKYFIKSK